MPNYEGDGVVCLHLLVDFVHGVHNIERLELTRRTAILLTRCDDANRVRLLYPSVARIYRLRATNILGTGSRFLLDRIVVVGQLNTVCHNCSKFFDANDFSSSVYAVSLRSSA
jgi:hypothetical protein